MRFCRRYEQSCWIATNFGNHRLHAFNDQLMFDKMKLVFESCEVFVFWTLKWYLSFNHDLSGVDFFDDTVDHCSGARLKALQPIGMSGLYGVLNRR